MGKTGFFFDIYFVIISVTGELFPGKTECLVIGIGL
jgi:hypothetical protein